MTTPMRLFEATIWLEGELTARLMDRAPFTRNGRRYKRDRFRAQYDRERLRALICAVRAMRAQLAKGTEAE